MTTKYMLVRKSKKGNWKPCWLTGDDGVSDYGATTTDKYFVEQERDVLSRFHVGVTYAVLEIMEE